LSVFLFVLLQDYFHNHSNLNETLKWTLFMVRNLRFYDKNSYERMRIVLRAEIQLYVQFWPCFIIKWVQIGSLFISQGFLNCLARGIPFFVLEFSRNLNAT
jgi:hypothetical protein